MAHLSPFGTIRYKGLEEVNPSKQIENNMCTIVVTAWAYFLRLLLYVNKLSYNIICSTGTKFYNEFQKVSSVQLIASL